MRGTIHLDTAKWIDLSRNDELAERFHAAVSAQKLTIGLSFILVLEFARPKQERTRRDVTQFVDAAIERHGVVWAQLRRDIEIAESQAELWRRLSVPHCLPDPWRSSLPDSLPNDGLGSDMQEWREWPVERHVEHLHTSPNYQNLYDAFRTNEHPGHISDDVTLRHPADKALMLLPDLIQSPSGLAFYLGTSEREAYRDGFSIERCPAIELSYGYNVGWKQSGKAVPNDLEDLFHLASVAYSEVAFVDSGTRELLLRGGVPEPRLPRTNSELSDWVDMCLD